jgi:hypothetical protein
MMPCGLGNRDLSGLWNENGRLQSEQQQQERFMNQVAKKIPTANYFNKLKTIWQFFFFAAANIRTAL